MKCKELQGATKKKNTSVVRRKTQNTGIDNASIKTSKIKQSKIKFEDLPSYDQEKVKSTVRKKSKKTDIDFDQMTVSDGVSSGKSRIKYGEISIELPNPSQQATDDIWKTFAIGGLVIVAVGAGIGLAAKLKG